MAERVWPKRGGEAEGRRLSASRREACSCVEASERERNEGFVKRLSLWKTVGFSRRARGGFEASEQRLRKKVQCVETVALEGTKVK